MYLFEQATQLSAHSNWALEGMADQIRPSNTIQLGLAVVSSQQPMAESQDIDGQIKALSLYDIPLILLQDGIS